MDHLHMSENISDAVNNDRRHFLRTAAMTAGRLLLA